MTDRPRSDWFTPGPILGILGMMGAIAGGWMSFEARISKVEQAREFDRAVITETRADLKSINDKLDRLVERGR